MSRTGSSDPSPTACRAVRAASIGSRLQPGGSSNLNGLYAFKSASNPL